MKYYLPLSLAIFLSIFGCKPSTNKEENITNQTIKKENEAIDTTYFFVRWILNASPKEVASKLGSPDQPLTTSRDCAIDNAAGTCLQGSYQGEKYYVEYSNNRLKWVEIERFQWFREDVIQRLGFQKLNPTFSGKEVISWRGPEFKGNIANGPLLSIPGIIEISVAKSSSGYFARVELEDKYDRRF